MPTNGKGDPELKSLDLEHELPAAEETEATGAAEAGATAQEMERLRAEYNAVLDRLARLQAEFDNYRKRAAREQEDFRAYALADALKSLLPVLDSFDRALAARAAAPKDDFRAGIELINRQFHDALSKLGVEPVAAVGQPFDPNVHQAIEMVETSEAKDNQVVEELQRGYKLRDRLLRPAMVRVAHNPKKR